MKKIFRFVLCATVLLVMQIIFPVTVAAHGFHHANSVPKDQVEMILKNTDFNILEHEIDCISIECFDAHENGNYAIGFQSKKKHIIQIYDYNGCFQTGISFATDGSYSFIIDEEFIEIYFSRSSLVIKLNLQGECVSIKEVPINEYNLSVGEAIYAMEKVVGPYRYYLDRDVGFAVRNYARLVQVDSEGNEKVLFDVTKSQTCLTLFWYLMIATCLYIWGIGMKTQIITYLKKSSNSN